MSDVEKIKQSVRDNARENSVEWAGAGVGLLAGGPIGAVIGWFGAKLFRRPSLKETANKGLDSIKESINRDE